MGGGVLRASINNGVEWRLERKTITKIHKVDRQILFEAQNVRVYSFGVGESKLVRAGDSVLRKVASQETVRRLQKEAKELGSLWPPVC